MSSFSDESSANQESESPSSSSWSAGSTPATNHQHRTARRKWTRITSFHLILLSSLIHLALLVYADHVDSHPERYGGLKYTDVDWRVVSDAAKLIFTRGHHYEDRAKGWVVRYLNLPIGDPYQRSTFRYTPLLPLMIAPTLVRALLGKSTLAFAPLCIPPLLLALTAASDRARSGPKAGAPFWATHLIWTLNPFVLNITTRGSPEAFICLLVALVQYCLRRAADGTRATKSTWVDRAAVIYALAVGWKIYPVIYVPTIWSFLARRNGGRWFAGEVWRFGLVTAGTFAALNVILWSIWGQPFLDHTYLYHLTRLDHRHNFSPYFYPIYLSLFTASQPSHTKTSIITITLRHPLTSFLPQVTLVLFSGFMLTPLTGFEFAMFAQTVIFVIFNKVCTSQYFMWFLPLIPPIIPHLRLSRSKTLVIISAWIAGQALWLATAYQLELMARGVYLYLWTAGLVLFALSVWVIGELIDSWDGKCGRSEVASDRIKVD